MDSKNADILQIKKYLEGKLDTRAMYELERRALDDPFLMDAMEGYEAAGNQTGAAAELATALNSRLQRPPARIISMSRLAIAASIVTVLGVGGWWLFSRPVTNTAEVYAKVKADKTAVTPAPLVNEPQIVINKDSMLALNKPRAVIRSPRRTYYSGTPMQGNDENATSDETAEIASSATANGSFLAEAPVTMRSRAKTDSVPLDEMLVMGYTKERKKANAQNNALREQSISASKIAAAPVVQNTVSGKVISAEDGQPLPGVTVRAGNSANAVFTDKDGAYTLKLDSTNTNITYNYPGFGARQLNGANNALTNTVKLEPQTSALSEVVAVGYGTGKAPDAVQPKYGWENFQKYLNANSVSPNGKTGSYRVSFTVEKDGSLSNFEINKGDTDIAGQKAVQLIKNGPEWVGSPRGEPKKITVTVKFHKPEK